MNIANDNNSKDLGNCKHSSKDIRNEYNARTETDSGSFKITAITDIDNDNNDIDEKDNHSVFIKAFVGFFIKDVIVNDVNDFDNRHTAIDIQQ